MNISDRIRYVRENLPEGKLSRREFADRMGVSQGVIQNAEEAEVRLKDRKISESLLKLICSTYKVNYLWLTEGRGEMMQDLSLEDLVDKYMIGESPLARSIMKAFVRLPDEEWAKLRDMIDRIKKEGL